MQGGDGAAGGGGRAEDAGTVSLGESLRPLVPLRALQLVAGGRGVGGALTWLRVPAVDANGHRQVVRFAVGLVDPVADRDVQHADAGGRQHDVDDLSDRAGGLPRAVVRGDPRRVVALEPAPLEHCPEGASARGGLASGQRDVLAVEIPQEEDFHARRRGVVECAAELGHVDAVRGGGLHGREVRRAHEDVLQVAPVDDGAHHFLPVAGVRAHGDGGVLLPEHGEAASVAASVALGDAVVGEAEQGRLAVSPELSEPVRGLGGAVEVRLGQHRERGVLLDHP